MKKDHFSQLTKDTSETWVIHLHNDGDNLAKQSGESSTL